MEELIKALETIKTEYDGCEEIKIYYKNPKSYCVKLLAQDKIIGRVVRGSSRKPIGERKQF